MLDLRRTVDAQAERARLQGERDAERVAREIDAGLRDPGVADRVPADARFWIDGDRIVVRPPVALEPEPAFDPERRLDVLARERLRRAGRAPTAEDALAELAPLVDDPAIGADARDWVRVRMAWLAHRAALTAQRDGLLADAHESASALLLRAKIGSLEGAELDAAFARVALRISVHDALGLCDALADLGVSTAAMRREVDAVTIRREILGATSALRPAIVATREPDVRAIGDALLLIWPSIATGAWVSRDAALALCQELSADADVTLATAASMPPGAVPTAAGLLAVVPAAVAPPGLLAGPTGTALLITALALVCGGGSFLALRALRREADALRLRTEFLTTVTHELKTPLAGVRLVAELLADDHVQGERERHEWLGRLNAEAVRLGVLIENVLDLGRLDRGERPHTPERADVAGLVAETTALFTPLAERDGFDVRVELPESPVWALVDRDALRQALVNVLDNARKYGTSPVDVGVRNGDGAVQITVRDHGAGIEPGERDAIFDRFRRGSLHGHGSIPGVGIGLHLARAIVERHGGTLATVEPDSGGGACFVFRLPGEPGGPQ